MMGKDDNIPTHAYVRADIADELLEALKRSPGCGERSRGERRMGNGRWHVLAKIEGASMIEPTHLATRGEEVMSDRFWTGWKLHLHS